MTTQTGFYLELGYSVKADSVGQDELVQQLADWAEEHGTLEGFTLDTGEKPTIEQVHCECGGC